MVSKHIYSDYQRHTHLPTIPPSGYFFFLKRKVKVDLFLVNPPKKINANCYCFIITMFVALPQVTFCQVPPSAIGLSKAA